MLLLFIFRWDVRRIGQAGPAGPSEHVQTDGCPHHIIIVLVLVPLQIYKFLELSYYLLILTRKLLFFISLKYTMVCAHGGLRPSSKRIWRPYISGPVWQSSQS